MADAKETGKRKAVVLCEFDGGLVAVDDTDEDQPLAKRLRSKSKAEPVRAEQDEKKASSRRMLTYGVGEREAIGCRCEFCERVYWLNNFEPNTFKEYIEALQIVQKSLEGEDRLKLCESPLGLYQYAKVAERIYSKWVGSPKTYSGKEHENVERHLLERALRPFVGLYIPNEYRSDATSTRIQFGVVSDYQKWEVLMLYDRAILGRPDTSNLSAAVLGNAVLARPDDVRTRVVYIQCLFNGKHDRKAMDAIQWARIHFSDDPDALAELKRELAWFEEDMMERHALELRRVAEDPEVRRRAAEESASDSDDDDDS